MKTLNRTHLRKKIASAFLITFFVAIVLVIFYMVYLQAKLVNPVVTRTEATMRGYIGSYVELLKKFSFHSLRDSGTRSSYINALKGGEPQSGYWENYAYPTPPPLENVNGHIAKRSQEFCEEYLKNVRNYSFGKITYVELGNFNETKVWVEEADLVEDPVTKKAKADDGFQLSAKGYMQTLIQSETENESRASIHDYTVDVYPWRYYFMYRIIREWTRENCLAATSCASMPLLKGKGNSATCMIPAVGTGIEDPIVKACVTSSSPLSLQSKFNARDAPNQYVECTYQMLCQQSWTEKLVAEAGCASQCCDTQPPNSCAPIPGCYGIPCIGGPCDNNQCQEAYRPNPPSQEFCGKVEIPDPCTPPTPAAPVSGSCFGYGEEHHISFIAQITCTDKKYHQPISSKGLVDLTYSFLVHVYLIHRVDPPQPSCTCDERVLINPCPEGYPKQTSCGCCGSGRQDLTCDSATGIISSSECTGETNCQYQESCGTCGKGKRTRTCTAGSGWTVSACENDPGEECSASQPCSSSSAPCCVNGCCVGCGSS